jgi:hypothetical protein
MTRQPPTIGAPARPARATRPAAAPPAAERQTGRQTGRDDTDPDDAPAARAGPAARLDGRRAHVVDRAAVYVALADLGLTAAQIARRRRKSKGHVSILLRLGRALRDLPEDERAALRHPRITWRLVQGLVRTDVDPASLRRQLRAALGGFSTHNVDRRRGRRSGAAAAPAAAPGVAWGWDAAWFARDPVGYAAAHLAHLTHLHRVVEERARGAAAARLGAAVDGGQSLRGLQRRLADLTAAARSGTGGAEQDAERAALTALAAIGRALRRAADGEPSAGAPPARNAAAPGAGEPDGVSPEDVAADLSEG